MFQWLNSYEAVTSSQAIQLKLNGWLRQPTHDDTIEGKIVYIQLFFERYKGEIVLRFKACQYINTKISCISSMFGIGRSL